ELSGLNGKSYEDLELLYMQGKLKDRAKDLFEQLRKLREEGENISKALEDGAESWKQALSGITFESAQEALKSMLEDGRVD
ncbi:hypothetical protein, partial [Escherichia coli]|uniref:hypothetical protein n=1 Tax=Escherichia coli TaxID=562 RepID=UPI003CE5B28A